MQPYAEWEGQTVNIYWREVEEAAEYKVTVFRIVDGANIYKLKDYYVERVEHFLAITGLVGCGYAFKVSALNRAGKEIVVAKGINGEGCPIAWDTDS